MSKFEISKVFTKRINLDKNKIYPYNDPKKLWLSIFSEDVTYIDRIESNDAMKYKIVPFDNLGAEVIGPTIDLYGGRYLKEAKNVFKRIQN